MNISLSLVIFIEIFSITTHIDVVEGWKWGWKSKRKRWNRSTSESAQFCSQGQCVEAWRCPNHFIGSCAEWNNKPMVCCVLNNEESYYNVDEVHTYSPSAAKDKPYVWKQTTLTSTEKYNSIDKGHLQIPCSVDTDGRSLVRATPISSLGGIFKNSNGRFTTHTPYKKVSNMQHVTNKVKSFTRVMTITDSWHKQPTAASKITFPTESRAMSKTKSTTLATKLLKETSDNSLHSTSTLSPWSYTARRTSVTEYPTLTTNVVKKTSEKSLHVTRTLIPWGYTTRKIFTSPRPRPTSYEYHEKGNESWGKPTASRPTKRQDLYPRNTTRFTISKTLKTTKKSVVNPTTTLRTTKRPIVTSPTRRTTRNYMSTTALPDMNDLVCGYRNRRTGRQGGKIYEHVGQPIGDVYSDFTGRKHRLPFERIVGGEEAEPFSWPWVVALYKVTPSGGNRLLSAGSLINEKFVLTAAHVFTPEDLRTASFVVMLGTHDAQDAVAQYHVSSVLQHPQYEHRYYYHDIALLKLNEPVTFNEYVMPVCLPSPGIQLLRDEHLEGKNVTVMGWGDESFGGKSSRVLKEATFPIVSRVSCNTSYIRVASNRFPKGITSDMLCAGDPNGGKDACQGDSGGPLTSIVNRRHTQIGIVSFGYKCGDKEYPGVYTKVASYLNWIYENIQHDQHYDYY